MPSPTPAAGVGVLSDVVARGLVQHHRSGCSTVSHSKAMGLSERRWEPYAGGPAVVPGWVESSMPAR